MSPVAFVQGLTLTIVVWAPRECARPIDAVLPQTQAAEESIGVITEPGARREPLEFLGVAAAENYVVGLEGRDQVRDHYLDVMLPFLAPQPFEAALADIAF